MANDPMLEMFIFENNQLTERLEEVLMEGESAGGLSEDHINEIFRIMHTIKGSAAMMQFTHISTLGHAVEDMFFYIRENKDCTPEWVTIIDLCLESADFFKEEVGKIQQGLDSDGDETPLLERIKVYMNILTGKGAPEPAVVVPEAPAAPDTPAEGDARSKKAKAGQKKQAAETSPQSGAGQPSPSQGTCFQALVRFEDGCKMENIRAYQIVNALSDIAHHIVTTPEDLLEDCSDQIIKAGFSMLIYADCTLEKIQSLINESLFVKGFDVQPAADAPPVPDAADVAGTEEAEETGTKPEAGEIPAPELSVTPNAAVETAPVAPPVVAAGPIPSAFAAPVAAAAAPPASDAKKPAAATETKSSFISVNVDKLDRLMDLVGELVISVSMVVGCPDLENIALPNFEKASSMLVKNTGELQDVIMSVRMIPISSTFHKMHRIVRDLTRKLSKDVDFVILGEETEVDKNIIDNLSDPLMHIIRNSMDHGIEDKEARMAIGKPAQGKIVLEARNSGSDVLISCTDDGKGLDRDKILSKAARQGLLNRPENEYTDREAYQFIMMPGFSTNEQVTELSGRGVGMDVVKKNIEKIGGTVLLDSTPGEGMTVTIRIPLTLSILAGIELRAGENVYIVPTLNIRESFVPRQNDIIVDPEGFESVLFRGEAFPIIRLYELFGVEGAVTRFEDGIMIMMEDEGRMVGLFADCLVGEQTVVVKPIPPFIVNRIGVIRGVSGCTILGNGNISLIIDVKSLTEKPRE